MLSKKENRKIAFDNFVKKRGLEEYSFFIRKNDYNKGVYLIPTKNIVENFEYISAQFHMIRSVTTLIRRTRETMSSLAKIYIKSDAECFPSIYEGWDEFKSLEDFRKYKIITKLAGIES